MNDHLSPVTCVCIYVSMCISIMQLINTLITHISQYVVVTGPASALFLPALCYQLASCISHFLRDGYEITILSLGSSEGWESLLTTQSPERLLADAPADAPIAMHTLSGLQTKSNWSWGGRRGDGEKGPEWTSKLCACPDNKKIKFNFILLFIFSLSPNMNIGHVFQKCSLKALIELLSSWWHQTSSQLFFLILDSHLLTKRNTYLWI